MGIRLRTKKLIYSGLAGAGITLGLVSAGGYILYQNAQEREIELKNEYQAKVEQLEKAALQSEVAYSLARDVKSGELIDFDMLQEVYLPSAASSKDKFLIGLLDGEESGKYYAKTDLKANTVLTDSMIYKDQPLTRDVREAEYAFIELPTNLEVGNHIDIRIQFPSGDDFILLSKKEVKDLIGMTIRFDVDEGEILTMSSAIVDAYVEGAKIYAMPYVDQHLQDPSEMTYPVKENVKELIQESPNIVNIAKLNLTEQNRARVEANIQATQPDEVDKLRSGENATRNAVNEQNDQLSAEERLNEANKEIQQEEIINGTAGGEQG